MNNRERIINTVLCNPVDRLPYFCVFGPWWETILRWRSEGLPEDKNWEDSFDFDPGIQGVCVNLGYCPSFMFEELEDKGKTKIVRDEYGIIKEIRTYGSSVPRYIDYPVKDEETWKQIKLRLDANDPARFPENWEELANNYNDGEKIVQIGDYPYGLFGTLRDMMGVEELLISFYTQPELIHEIMDYLTDFWISIYSKVCETVKIDIIHMWEDMSGKTGSLISPKMVREFMMPCYKKIRKFADEHNIPIFSLDTDGNVEELVPLFIESGLNLIYPFEVQAGCDIVEYRKKYPNLCIMGGIDKIQLTKTTEDIDAELNRISVMFDQTGYIPALDHLIHPQISLENFKYFTEALKKKIKFFN